jgi:MscS family membrane protein
MSPQETPEEPALVEELCTWISERYGEGPQVAAAVFGISILAGMFLHYVGVSGLMLLFRRTKSDIDDRILQSLRWPVIVSVVLAGSYVAVNMLGEEAWTAGLREPLGRSLLNVALVIWTVQGLRISSILLRYASALSDRFALIDLRTMPLFANLVTVVVLAVAFYLVLLIWNIDAAGWLASAGIVGVAVGFAAKDTLSNLFAGVFIVADAPYQLGDYIVLDDGVRGEVVHIGLRSTRIKTRNDVLITIPNAVIGTSKIVNQSGGGDTAMRVGIPVGVGYDSDVEQVKRVLLEVVEQQADIRAEPAPRVRFRRLGDSALEFELLVWIDEPGVRGGVVDSILTKVVSRFRETGIEIPFPQRTLHLMREAEV